MLSCVRHLPALPAVLHLPAAGNVLLPHAVLPALLHALLLAVRGPLLFSERPGVPLRPCWPHEPNSPLAQARGFFCPR